MAGRGYVKLHRDAMDHSVFRDEWLWKVFCWCVMKANFRPVTGAHQTVPRGAFTTGRNRAAEELDASPSRVYRAFDRLKALGCITVKPNNNWTTITVCNYETYNSTEDDDRTTNGQPADNERTSGDTTNGHSIKNPINQEAKKPRSNTPKPPRGIAVESDPLFESFWREFPSGRKQGKELARKAFTAALKKTTAQTIIEAAMEYAASPVGCGEFVKGPAAWLNQGCWADDRAAWNRSSGGGKSLFDPDDPTGNMAVVRRYMEARNGEDD
jgi:hypothetical protein